MSGLKYYYPSNADEAGAPPGIEVECDGYRVTLVVDTDSRHPAQIVELTGEDAVRLAGALNRAALCALPKGADQ